MNGIELMLWQGTKAEREALHRLAATERALHGDGPLPTLADAFEYLLEYNGCLPPNLKKRLRDVLDTQPEEETL
jgi:hypothetical protein